jgi:hypothetical protein
VRVCLSPQRSPRPISVAREQNAMGLCVFAFQLHQYFGILAFWLTFVLRGILRWVVPSIGTRILIVYGMVVVH